MNNDPPSQDYVGLAFSALAFSAALGLALNAAVGVVVRTLQAGARPEDQLSLSAPDALVLLLGTFLACFAAAIATWRIMSPVRNTFRQGMLAMVSFFAAFVLSMLTMPVDRVFGRPGLVAAMALGVAATTWIGRRIRRTVLVP